MKLLTQCSSVDVVAAGHIHSYFRCIHIHPSGFKLSQMNWSLFIFSCKKCVKYIKEHRYFTKKMVKRKITFILIFCFHKYFIALLMNFLAYRNSHVMWIWFDVISLILMKKTELIFMGNKVNIFYWKLCFCFVLLFDQYREIKTFGLI